MTDERSIGNYGSDAELAFKIASFVSRKGIRITRIDEKYFNDFEMRQFRVRPQRKDIKKIELFATSRGDYSNFWAIANRLNNLLGRRP